MEGLPGRAKSRYKAVEIRDNVVQAGTASVALCLAHRAPRIVSSLMMGMDFIYPGQFTTGLK